ncbi:MAG: ribonuclease J [Ruminococcaceae bacterium]|nr:ribonuclease J [Oscillospiraceae bacterium]
MAKKKKNKSMLKVIPLGGLGEIGCNITAVEYEDDIIVIDCGFGFPDDNMLGIDLVIPDVTYLEKNIEKVRGIFLTHGHEDHIGALPYILKTLNVPIYGTSLTLEILANKLIEFKLDKVTRTVKCAAGDTVDIGCFSVEFIRVNHSIADSVAFSITTPVGVVIFTGDFKIDLTPIDGEMINLTRFGELGNKGVLALFSDSTNAERPGYTPSERTVGHSFDNIFHGTTKRVVIASFSSNVHRVQQIIDASEKYGRKVAIIGRSMINIVTAAIKLGYMHVPEGMIVDIDEIKKYRPDQLTLITTGSQGEPMSALYRMANSTHDKVHLGMDDLVVISATPIPGNEKLVSKIINELLKKEVEVVYDRLAEVHVSGHACQEEIKTIIALTKPKYFVPLHGEYKHVTKCASLAEYMGVPHENILIPEVGKVMEFGEESARFNGNVPAGKVLVDGYGVGDVGNVVLRDRRHLACDGLIVVVATIDLVGGYLFSGPDIVSRGFVYVRESEELMEELKNIAKEAIYYCIDENISDANAIKSKVKDDLTKYIYSKTKRKPMILPIIME